MSANKKDLEIMLEVKTKKLEASELTNIGLTKQVELLEGIICQLNAHIKTQAQFIHTLQNPPITPAKSTPEFLKSTNPIYDPQGIFKDQVLS